MAKTATRSATRYPRELQEALAWLGARPAEDPLRDLAPLRSHLAAIAVIGIPPLQYLKILELFQARAGLASSAVKPLLFDATLPVAKRLRTIAHGLMHVHGALAAGYLKTLREIPAEKLHDLALTPAHLCDFGLGNLSQQYEVAQLVCAPAPPDFWLQAQTFYGLIGTDHGGAVTGAAGTALQRLKAMLAFAAAQPEGFSPREAVSLTAYLSTHAAAVEIRSATEPGDDSDFWLDAGHGFTPTATVRRPPTRGTSLHYSCTALSELARAHLASLQCGELAEAIGLPRDAASGDCRDTIARAAERWASPPRRETRRRRHGYRVQVCTHLGALWQQSGSLGLAEVELPASDWMVLNESPRGYAIMHVAGNLAGLVAGSAIGLRPATNRPWNICVVRWARSDNPEHIELGLEVVAPLAQAVRIARRGADGEQRPTPALLLPPLPALRRGEALLTARGGYAPGPFALIDEASGRIRVAECTAGPLSMHTACIEIFEFERKLVPG